MQFPGFEEVAVSTTAGPREHAQSHTHPMQAPAASAGQGAERRQRRSRQRAARHPRLRGRYVSAVYSGDGWRPMFRVT